MLKLLAELNSLQSIDIVFFVLIAVIVALCVGIYFLIPVINKKQYQEMRDNLSKREVAFKANLKGEANTEASSDNTEEQAATEE